MDFIKQKFGPLPLWAWAVIVLVVIVGFVYLKGGGSGLSGLFGSGGSGAVSGSTPSSGLQGSLGNFGNAAGIYQGRMPNMPNLGSNPMDGSGPIGQQGGPVPLRRGGDQHGPPVTAFNWPTYTSTAPMTQQVGIVGNLPS